VTLGREPKKRSTNNNSLSPNKLTLGNSIKFAESVVPILRTLSKAIIDVLDMKDLVNYPTTPRHVMVINKDVRLPNNVANSIGIVTGVTSTISSMRLST
jgi:hypothetical protein